MLHSFQGGAERRHVAERRPLTLDKAGNMYGTVPQGLPADLGGVYKLTTSGKITWLYAFTGTGDDSDHPTGVYSIKRETFRSWR